MILDTPAPNGGLAIATRVKARANVLGADVPRNTPARVVTVAARTGRFAVSSAYAHAERRFSLSSAGLFPRRGYHQYDLFLRLHTRMALEYHPTAPFDSPVLLVRGRAGDPDDLGWSHFVRGPVSTEVVVSDHLGLLRAPAVGQLGEVVRKALG